MNKRKLIDAWFWWAVGGGIAATLLAALAATLWVPSLPVIAYPAIGGIAQIAGFVAGGMYGQHRESLGAPR